MPVTNGTEALKAKYNENIQCDGH